MEQIDMINKIVQNIKRGKANLKLIEDKIVDNSKLDVQGKGEFIKVCEFGNDDTFRGLYRIEDKYYYIEKEYCADNDQMGCCKMGYYKVYEVII